MFAKLHLLSQDTPQGGGLRWRPHPYLRMVGAVPKGPAVFDWSARQREDLEVLWRDPASDGARERLGEDLAVFCDKLGWAPDGKVLEDAEEHGDEYLLTLSAVPPELYLLPWEVIHVGAARTCLADFPSAQVRYAMPGLGPRELQSAPPAPGVLFAWSAAGGSVPHDAQAAAIRAAAGAGGVAFHELAEVDERRLQAALDAGPPSVLHLLCHGVPGPEGEPSRLKWGASDSPSEIAAPRLARMLREHSEAIRLVVLSACGSGDGRGDPLFMSSLAQELHKVGIQSVVASRYPLSTAGACVMTAALYDRMLRDAWSLERALRHTRQALFRADETGETHPGDAYGIQLYAYDTEWFVSDNEIEAERSVLSSYPFGTPARPVPSSDPPSAELTLRLASDPGLSGDQLIERLRKVSEDHGLTVVVQSKPGNGTVALIVHTTVDGAQRLLGAWRSKALQIAVGVVVAALIVTRGITSAFGATASSVTSKVVAAKAGSKTAAALGGLAAKLATTKVAVVAVVGSVTIAGAAAVYRVETRPARAHTVETRVVEADRSRNEPAVTPDPPSEAIPAEPPSAADGSQPAVPAVTPFPAPRSPAAEPGTDREAPRTLPNVATPTAAPPASAPPAPPSAPRSTESVPRTASSESRTTGSEPRTTESEPRTTESEPRTASSEPRTTGSEPRTTGEPGALAAEPRAPGAEPETPAPEPEAPADPGSAPPTDAKVAPQCGNGIVEPGETCDDGNTRDGDGCSSRCLIEGVRTKVSVTPSVLDTLRIAGNMDVRPGKDTKAAMVRYHQNSLKGVVKLCVNAKGVVSDAMMSEPTGYDEYDAGLLAAVRGWRYKPYMVGSAAVPVCSTVEFVYVRE